MRTQRRALSRRAGLTALEIAITMGIFALAGVALHTVVRVMNSSYTSGIRRIALDTEGGRAMVELIETLRMAERSSLSAVPAPPFSATVITFRRTDRIRDAMTEWVDPERILYDPVAREVRWIEHPGLANEQVVHRCSGVSPLLEGEVANGLDDNGNGLIDEPGFCMELQGNVLTARFTLEGTDAEGRLTQRTWTRSIECRN